MLINWDLVEFRLIKSFRIILCVILLLGHFIEHEKTDDVSKVRPQLHNEEFI